MPGSWSQKKSEEQFVYGASQIMKGNFHLIKFTMSVPAKDKERFVLSLYSMFLWKTEIGSGENCESVNAPFLSKQWNVPGRKG